MLKFAGLILLLLTGNCFSQGLQAELMVGAAGYSGDLSKKFIAAKGIGPSVSINAKYPLYNQIVLLRGGITYAKIGANDKDDETLGYRNLNFKTNILEGNLGVEVNLLNPEEYYGLPYLFAGVGLYHFNPYTFDKDNKKTFLQPLGTEGQGLKKYPDRKMYSLTQLCIPFAGGWKYKFSEKIDLVYEIGGRFLFTDYLDDVSNTYADPESLFAERGEKAVELAYRIVSPPLATEGIKRGNPKVKDWYFITGLKIVYKFGAVETQY